MHKESGLNLDASGKAYVAPLGKTHGIWMNMQRLEAFMGEKKDLCT
jgi:hypothetical protein